MTAEIFFFDNMNEKFIIKISCGWVDQKWVNKALFRVEQVKEK